MSWKNNHATLSTDARGVRAVDERPDREDPEVVGAAEPGHRAEPYIVEQTDILPRVLAYLREHAVLIGLVAALVYHFESVQAAKEAEYKSLLREHEQQILKMAEAEKQRLIERETELVRQRDDLFRLLREETAKNTQIIRVRETRWKTE